MENRFTHLSHNRTLRGFWHISFQICPLGQSRKNDRKYAQFLLDCPTSLIAATAVSSESDRRKAINLLDEIHTHKRTHTYIVKCPYIRTGGELLPKRLLRAKRVQTER